MVTVGYVGSRNAQAYFFGLTDGSICVRCGCFAGTIEEFEAEVHNTHGDTKHGKVYRKAIEMARLQFGEE